jgi:hypothetical protein
MRCCFVQVLYYLTPEVQRGDDRHMRFIRESDLALNSLVPGLMSIFVGTLLAFVWCATGR